MKRHCGAVLLVGAFVLGCSRETSGPTEEFSPPSFQTAAWCEAHPTECGGGSADPNPGEPGYFIAAGFSQSECTTSGGVQDVDYDGVRDFCEVSIASRFAPGMYHSRNDDVSGEPKWAAQWFGPGDQVLRIVYALAYHEDLGSVISVCNLPLPYCNGHNGDAETVVLDLKYSVDTEHWFLHQMHLSRHEEWDHVFASGGSVTYPDKFLGYPRVWVARWKHANYVSDGACDNGGPGGTVFSDLGTLIAHPDDCDSSKQFRPVITATNNLGSDYANQDDCFSSVAGFSGVECFWLEYDGGGNPMKFRGWNLPSGGEPPGYREKLAAAGFVLGVPAQF